MGDKDPSESLEWLKDSNEKAGIEPDAMTPHCPHVSFIQAVFWYDFKCELMLILLFPFPPWMFPVLCGSSNNPPPISLPNKLLLVSLLRYASFLPFPHHLS
jgi:hypothetical protein